MPIRETNGKVHLYKLPRLGVNLHTNVMEINEEECLVAQNCIIKNGLVRRDGYEKFETDEVSAGKAISGLHRFYFGTSSKLLLVASGVTVKEHDGATWVVIDATVGQSQTDGAVTHMTTWGALQKVYITNGVDGQIKYDGTTATVMTAASLDNDIVQFLPYQDRLLTISTTNPGDLTWGPSFSDSGTWGTVANIGVRPDTKLFGMVLHSIARVETGYEAGVLLAGANGMYIFKGTDLRWPNITTGAFTFYSLATNVGCNAVRTMKWTPAGTIYLGMDKQVYLLPFNSIIPIPIGDKVRSAINGFNGIEDIPAAQLANACATYHDGFYKLSFTPSGGSTNTIQFWLDVNRLKRDETGLYGPWYGPMKGMVFSVFANQDGPGDNGELMAGEDNGVTGSFVYQANKPALKTDNDAAIEVVYQSYFNPLDTPESMKVVHWLEFELLDSVTSIMVDLLTPSKVALGDKTLIVAQVGAFYNELFYNEGFYTGDVPVYVLLEVSPSIRLRRMTVVVTHSSATEIFELYSINAFAIEESLIFEQED